jgi:hypothetical protein
MVMPVAPMNNFGGGFGNGFGDNGWWIILLFILLGNNGWGGYGGGIGSGAGFVDASVQRGFDQSAIMSGLTGIGNNVVSGFGDVQTALCGGFAGVNAGIANGFAQMEIANNARQIADMQQEFALQSQLASCCCENRLGTADLKYTIATEACADRAAVTNALENVIANQTANTQRILDTLCADKIDAKNEQIMALERQLAMANLAASQTAQTAEILSRLPATTTTA